ncbi:molybdate ABC transporter substrate-binding protein [Caldimonas sp. KR1-144]|uniref:molybdate ABC transporter substrate-binding protein n=1 Tax=Caldimonas sp. KR1-144 TaxID=3400911 RepID=UPI003BFC41FD
MPRLRRHVVLLILSLALTGAARAQDVVVFAAASLGDVLQAIAREGGFNNLRFSFAASSTLARQIEQGAPAQIFISADEAWMDAVERRGAVLPGSRVDLATNRLAIVRAGAQEPAVPPETVDAARALLLPVLAMPDARIATGDPAHVPAGKYAQAALTSLGLWDAAAPRLARADNVRSALALVERGEAPLGIVYRTDALASTKVQVAALLPAASHAPIRYPMALLKGAGDGARRFHRHLQTPAAQALLRAAGFGAP